MSVLKQWRKLDLIERIQWKQPTALLALKFNFICKTSSVRGCSSYALYTFPFPCCLHVGPCLSLQVCRTRMAECCIAFISSKFLSSAFCHSPFHASALSPSLHCAALLLVLQAESLPWPLDALGSSLCLWVVYSSDCLVCFEGFPGDESLLSEHVVCETRELVCEHSKLMMTS